MRNVNRLSELTKRILGEKRNSVSSKPQRRRLLIEIMEARRLLTTIDLAALVAGQGMTIFGARVYGDIGFLVRNAGDVNGDGFDDLLIGSSKADVLGIGESYVIFGGASLPATIDVANLGNAGITIFGADVGDRSGRGVSSAGDVNGDGFEDLLIGAHLGDASGNAKSDAGESYVIFGGASLPATIDVANLGNAGITIFGADLQDWSGRSLSSAGDVNGDGFDDLLIGALGGDASGNAISRAGESYVIFGGPSLSATIDLADLGNAGITIFGADAGDLSGGAVSSAGDVNGDGFDDLLIGAYGGDASGNAKSYAGETYVIFGGASLPATIDVANLGNAGITIFGADAYDRSGLSVSSAGDVNGDGFDDLLIGALDGDTSGNAKLNAGESYVIFGGPSLSATIDLADLGNAGITIFGADANDGSGVSVSSAGDVNGDGFDDLLIGAPGGDASGNAKLNAGESYVIFGGASLPATIDLANLGHAGITIFGADAGDRSGRSVSSAGDVNGDGFDDLLIGANHMRNVLNGNMDGKSYVIFGGNFTSAVTHAGTDASETLTGTASADMMVGGRGNDTLIGNGGADVLIGGLGDDMLAISDLSFQRIVGGTDFDTLRLDGSGLHLNLTTIPDNRIQGVEQIDISGSGNNTLTLSAREVLNLSDESNTLIVRGNVGDTVNIGSGWSQGSNETIGSDIFEVFTQGAAVLKIHDDVDDVFAPTISSTIVASSIWSTAFIDQIDGVGGGNGLGFELVAGAMPLPWGGIDRLYIQFSEDVLGVSASTIELRDSNGPLPITVDYDPLTFMAEISLATPLTFSKLRLAVSDIVQDAAGNPLDGDSSGTAGGLFDLRFDVLPGDADGNGRVNGADLNPFSAVFNSQVTRPNYNERANWNGDDRINGADLAVFSQFFNRQLDGLADPTTPFGGGRGAAGSASVPYDDFFAFFDEEEEEEACGLLV